MSKLASEGVLCKRLANSGTDCKIIKMMNGKCWGVPKYAIVCFPKMEQRREIKKALKPHKKINSGFVGIFVS